MLNEMQESKHSGEDIDFSDSGTGTGTGAAGNGAAGIGEGASEKLKTEDVTEMIANMSKTDLVGES